ncbi:MAG: hypothetical protein GY715_01550 [Planctomycetes bacterium]|nr:hypothetical protein [Planctomycetota bacterium]
MTTALVLLCAASLAAASPTPVVEFTIDPAEGTVGDQLLGSIRVVLPPEMTFDPPRVGPQLGKFFVLNGSWVGPENLDGGSALWVWSGLLSAYETGELTLPPFEVVGRWENGAVTAESEPLPVTIASILDDEPASGETPEIADLKAPASIRPDYSTLYTALAILALLLVAAAVMWWLQRRYASRLSAVAMPDDPFHRTPPHVWVYAELKNLVERHLPEQGQIDLFYSELSRILKQYLSGRYRVDLLEQTTSVVPDLLRQSGTPEPMIAAISELLGACDLVKFARQRPEPSEWRGALERAYHVVDNTKPAEAPAEDERGVA